MMNSRQKICLVKCGGFQKDVPCFSEIHDPPGSTKSPFAVFFFTRDFGR
eukprot:UN04764